MHGKDSLKTHSAIGSIFVGLLLSSMVQSATLPPQIQPEDIPLQRPSDIKLLEPKPGVDQKNPRPAIQLPKPKSPESGSGLANALSINIKSVRFVGNTVFDATTLQEQIKDHLTHSLSALDLEEMRVALTQFYIKNGFINSGATIPDQDLNDGVLIFAITEGRLTQVRLDHHGKLNPYYVERRILTEQDQPLNIHDLQNRLYLLQKDPRIERINAVLGPGAARGESILDLQTTEARPDRLDLEFNNFQPPSVGEYYGSLNYTHLNVSGWGDKANVHLGKTKGLQNISLLYGIPLMASDTYLTLQAQNNKADVIDPAFSELDLQSESDSIGLGLEFPLYKAPEEEYNVEIRLDKRRSETFWAGISTPFSGTGSDNGVTRITALRFTQAWLKQEPQQVFALRHTINLGVKLLGPTLSDSGPDGHFTSWLLQYQWARRYPHQLQSVFRTDLQLTQDPLLSMEKFSVGGAHSVRGYRENQLVRDNGLAMSLEGRLPVFNSESGKQQVQVMAFYDFGQAWNTAAAGEKEDHQTIKSLGLGLRWNYGEKISATLYWADPRDDINADSADDGLQAKGYHVAFNAQLF